MKRARTEDGMEMEKENLDQIVDMPDRGSEMTIRRPSNMRTLHHRASPHSLDYWRERFPLFPDFVNEAFAAKTRGPEAYEEFLATTEKPGIVTCVQKELENGEIVTEPRTVTWF